MSTQYIPRTRLDSCISKLREISRDSPETPRVTSYIHSLGDHPHPLITPTLLDLDAQSLRTLREAESFLRHQLEYAAK